MDIGCGSLGLLAVLATPKHAASAELDDLLDVRRLIGIDVERSLLETSVQELQLNRVDVQDIHQGDRFTPVTTEVYAASLDEIIPELEAGSDAALRIDAIVLTEVIEHL